MKKHLLLVTSLILSISFFLYKKKKSIAKTEEKVLHLAIQAQISSLDPALFSDLYTAVELCKVYEGLLEYHYLKRPAELIPNLAESMPEVSADGLTYTFKIKQGVYFQDNECFKNGKGRELTAQDFVYSIMRFADAKTQSPLYSLIDGKILGLNEWREKYRDSTETNYDETLIGVQTIDRYTLKITLTKPWPQFLNILAMPNMMVVPKEAVDLYGKEFGNHPVGTGPFIIKNFNTQENKIVAYKNPTYRAKFYPTEASEECRHLLLREEKRLPFVDKVETYVLPEEQPRWLQFVSKKLDIIDVTGTSDLKLKLDGNQPIAEYKTQGILFMCRPIASTNMFVINNTSEPFKDNKYLRQAISMAYDRNKHNEIFNDGLQIIAQSLIPPSLEGYEKNFINENNIYNIEKAKKLMIKAGYPGGKGLDPIVLDIPTGTRPRQTAEFFQKCLEQIGIRIIISTNSWPELLNKARLGKTQIHTMGWCAAYQDAENFLLLFSYTNPTFAHYSNSEYDKLFKQASIMTTGPERTELYKKMNYILAEDIPAIFYMHSLEFIFYYSWVLNFEYFDAKKIDYIQYLDIDLEKKLKTS